MSKVLTIKDIKITDAETLEEVCKIVGGYILDGKRFKFYSKTVEGTGVQLRDWKYPVVIDETGSVQYDNYSGRWGKMDQLYNLIDCYQVVQTRKVAEELGCTCGYGDTIENLDSGAFYLEMEVPETCLSY